MQRSVRRQPTPWIALCLMGVLASMLGCKSAFVQAVVRNDSDRPIRLIEVDYPSASFGRESLDAHSQFLYRFKILGSGPTKVQWTDADKKEHTVKGPDLHEGGDGTLEIAITSSGARWTPKLR